MRLSDCDRRKHGFLMGGGGGGGGVLTEANTALSLVKQEYDWSLNSVNSMLDQKLRL